MGLFDDVRCELPLPETAIPSPHVVFQTKDTDDPYLESYTITKDGRLRRGESEFIDFHGDLRFYTCSDSAPVHWWEYRARFTNGRTERIDLVQFCPVESRT